MTLDEMASYTWQSRASISTGQTAYMRWRSKRVSLEQGRRVCLSVCHLSIEGRGVGQRFWPDAGGAYRFDSWRATLYSTKLPFPE